MDLGGLGGVIGAGVGGMLGGPAGAAAGATVGGGIDTNSANAARADAANEWSASQYATRYQTQVADLKAAGLNPMLAYQQSPGSAPTAQQVTFQNPFSAAAASYQQGVATEASAQQHLASAEQSKKMLEQIDASVAEIKERTKKIPLEADQIKFTIQKLAEEAANIAQDTENKSVLRKQMYVMMEKVKFETGLLKNQLAVEQALDNFGRTSKEALPMAKFLLDLFRSLK